MADHQTLQFRVTGYTGIDSFFSAIYTEKRMAKRIAKKSMRTGAPFADSVPGEDLTLLLLLPKGAFQIKDEFGNVERWTGPTTQIGL